MDAGLSLKHLHVIGIAPWFSCSLKVGHHEKPITFTVAEDCKARTALAETLAHVHDTVNVFEDWDDVLDLSAHYTGVPRCCGASAPRLQRRQVRHAAGVLFDSHCHVAANRHSLQKLSNVKAQMAIMSTNEDDWPSVSEASSLVQAVPAFGLHPWFCHKAEAGWPDRLRQLLLQHPDALVGEVGLDKVFRTKETRRCEMPTQVEALRAQLLLAHHLDRPVSMHCVQAWGKLMELLQECASQGLLPPAVALHSWGGPPEWIAQLTKVAGPKCALYFGFSEAINHKSGVGGRRERLEANLLAVPDNRLLLESDIDAPECVDTYMNMICRLVAELKGWTFNETMKVTCSNAVEFVHARAAEEVVD